MVKKVIFMEAYTPVSCGLYDKLEANATMRQQCHLSYRDESDELVEVQGMIVDVYAANHADFLKLEDGTEIRLDRIEMLNGEKAA